MMRSMLKSKSAVYEGNGAMDRSWEDELHCFSIETSEGGWGVHQIGDIAGLRRSSNQRTVSARYHSSLSGHLALNGILISIREL